MLLVLSGAGSTDAAQITGLSDQNMLGWDYAATTLFERTGLEQVRYIAAYDVAQHKDDVPCLTACLRFAEARGWIDQAHAEGKKVLVSFGDKVCDGCKAPPPTPDQYLAGVKAFRAEFPEVREYTAWNEPNHRRHVAPGLAAGYWNTLERECRGDCIVAAGDFSDHGDFGRYARSYTKALTGSPAAWAVHAYGAVDSGDFAALVDWIEGATQRSPVWITEVGALYCGIRGLKGATPRDALEYQNRSAANLNALLERAPARVERAYYYFFAKSDGRQESCPGFDSALIGAGNFERPALGTVFPGAVAPDRSALALEVTGALFQGAPFTARGLQIVLNSLGRWARSLAATP